MPSILLKKDTKKILADILDAFRKRDQKETFLMGKIIVPNKPNKFWRKRFLPDLIAIDPTFGVHWAITSCTSDGDHYICLIREDDPYEIENTILLKKDTKKIRADILDVFCKREPQENFLTGRIVVPKKPNKSWRKRFLPDLIAIDPTFDNHWKIASWTFEGDCYICLTRKDD